MLRCVARVCYPQKIELESMAELMQCVVHAPVRLAICESCSCSSNCHAVSVNSRRELQTLLNRITLFTRCYLLSGI